MGLTLTIDQGNTSAKAAAWEGSQLVRAEVFPQFDRQALESMESALGMFDKAMVSSVAHPTRPILDLLDAEGIPARELTHDTPLPIIIDYLTPTTLGLDRVAAAVGAWSLHPGTELLIVDAGTAVTYDRVTADGHFLGGNIAPGVGMRLRSLNAWTSRLPLVTSRGETPQWGTSTETALRSGAINGVVGEITYYRSLLPAGALVVMAGGWGKELASRLGFETDYQECLVNRGLNILS